MAQDCTPRTKTARTIHAKFHISWKSNCPRCMPKLIFSDQYNKLWTNACLISNRKIKWIPCIHGTKRCSCKLQLVLCIQKSFNYIYENVVFLASPKPCIERSIWPIDISFQMNRKHNNVITNSGQALVMKKYASLELGKILKFNLEFDNTSSNISQALVVRKYASLELQKPSKFIVEKFVFNISQASVMRKYASLEHGKILHIKYI